MLDEHSRALDLCGGSGHLTRSLGSVSPRPPVVTDISFIKLWLARHFTAPEADAVLADSELPLPFATGAFRFVVCNDAFHYIWHKALLAREMWRITDSRGVAAITHTHNADTWTVSQGTALRADHYRALFEHAEARVYSEHLALPDAIDGRLDLPAMIPSRRWLPTRHFSWRRRTIRAFSARTMFRCPMPGRRAEIFAPVRCGSG